MKMGPLIHNNQELPIPTGSLEMAGGRNSSSILKPDLSGLTSVNSVNVLQGARSLTCHLLR